MCVCIHVCKYGCMYACLYVCMNVCVCLYFHLNTILWVCIINIIYIYIYIYILADLPVVDRVKCKD